MGNALKVNTLDPTAMADPRATSDSVSRVSSRVKWRRLKPPTISCQQRRRAKRKSR